IPVTGDTNVEGDENFSVTLSTPTGATLDPAAATGTGTITEDDSLTLSINDASVIEGDIGNQVLTFTVSLSGPSNMPVSVDFTTVDGTATTADNDFTAQTGTLTFAPGETELFISVVTNGDVAVEESETLTVELSNASIGTIADNSGQGTIINDDGAGISIDDVTIVETDSGTLNMVFTVSLDQTSPINISVDFVTTDITATAGSDYTAVSGTLTFAPGITTQTITVPVIADTLVEDDETFTIDLSNPSNGNIIDSQGLATITDDDQAGLSVSDATLTEGNSGNTDMIFTVSLDQPLTQDVTVDVNTVDVTATAGTDYIAVASTVTIPAGQTEVTVNVPVIGDTDVEGDETFTLELSNPVNADIVDASAAGVILDDDVAIGNSVVAVDDSSSTPLDTAVSIPVLANDYDPEGDNFIITTVSDPANGSVFFTPDGTLIYTPDAGFTGSDSFTYTIRDENIDEALDTATVTVTVGGNSVTATADSAVTQTDTPVDIAVLVNDFDPNGDDFSLTAIFSQPANGTVMINADGTVTYTPNAGYAGQDTFTYEITDALGNTDMAQVTVVIDDDVPQATDDYRETPQNTPAEIDVLANDIDPQGDSLSVVATTEPANGSIVVNADGTITYTPNSDFFGHDTFTYTIDDGNGNQDIATVVIFVPQNGNLSGTAWLDSNLDTVIDADEPLVEGWTVNLLSADGTVVGTTTTDANGDYSFPGIEPGAGYVIQLVHPETAQVFASTDPITIEPGENEEDVDLPIDPSGVVYDAISRAPIAGALVQIINAGTGQALPDVCLGQGQQDQTTGSDGYYQFDVFAAADPICPTGATYRLVVTSPDGYQPAPSTLILAQPGAYDALSGQANAIVGFPNAPQAGQDTTYYFDFILETGDGDVVNNHIPLDPVGLDATIRLIKRAQSPDAVVGDLVRYTITAENTGSTDLVDGRITDTPAAGFNFVTGSARVSPTQNNFSESVNGRTIQFNNLDIDAGETISVSYVMRVGAGVTRGDYINRAIMDNGFAVNVSNEATATVRITADPDIDETTIVGKVFDDRDGDGFQDPGIATGVFIQGGFDVNAYVPNSTTVDYGNGPESLNDSNATLIRGINVGTIRDRISYQSEPPHVVIRQRLRNIMSLSDIRVTTAEGTRTNLTTAGSFFNDHYGDKARGLTAQDITIARQVTQLGNGEVELAVTVTNHGTTEAGIPGVRLATVEGLLVETDAYGRYHLAGIDGGAAERGRNFIIKVDAATLPRGTSFTTENPRVMRITGGLMNQFDFGVQLPKARTQSIEVKLGEVFFAKGNSDVSPRFTPMLAQLGQRLRQSDGGVLTIAGHSDCEAAGGSAESCDHLAQKRAKNIYNLLRPHLGEEMICKVSFRSRSRTYSPEECGGAL
ncbi:MAG: tandem-95 repeat protein, partial [Gammaproteobacteria bacterium]|nr:tandem-95 repeat protein [Gammaproteobacteria bacterium]